MTSDTNTAGRFAKKWSKLGSSRWFGGSAPVQRVTPSPNNNSSCVNCKCLAQTLFVVAVITFLILIIIFHSEVKVFLFYTLNLVRSLGYVKGALMMCVVNVIGALLFLPCLPFTLGAGFLYGTFSGTIIVSIASNLAAVVGFLVARYLARDIVEKRLGSKSSKIRLLDNAIAKDGLKIVLLVRSSPIHPYGVCNYLFGLTSVALRDYVIGSVVGMLPATVMEVYLGTAMANLADLVNGDMHGSTVGTVFFWMGLLVTLVVTIYISCYLKMRLDFELSKYEGDEEELEELAPDLRDRKAFKTPSKVGKGSRTDEVPTSIIRREDRTSSGDQQGFLDNTLPRPSSDASDVNAPLMFKTM